MANRVFLPHVAEKFDAQMGRMAPVHDFSAAARYGALISVLDAGDNPLMLARYMPKIRKTLEDFDENDYLVAVGDPTVIAACAGLILRRQHGIKMLKWDRRYGGGDYIVLEVRP